MIYFSPSYIREILGFEFEASLNARRRLSQNASKASLVLTSTG